MKEPGQCTCDPAYRLGTLHATGQATASPHRRDRPASRTEFVRGAAVSLAGLPLPTLVLDITDLSFFTAHAGGRGRLARVVLTAAAAA